MDELDYWTLPDRSPKPVVDLGGARCRRCPHPVPPVPIDKVRVARGFAGTFRAVFVCPYCRTDTAVDVALEDALRAYVAGAQVRRSPGPETPLVLDDLLDFALAVAHADDLARLALQESLR